VTTKQIHIPETVPLVQWEDGSIRVRNSRVTLDTIVGRMKVGDTVEEIHDGFPTVALTQINEILTWYFDNKPAADEYLEEGEREAEELRKKIESDPEYQVRRQEMLRRKAELRKI
jgi:uncharacterized protein (DUF433 family)